MTERVGLGKELTTLLSKNIRDYGMFIALIVIFVVFTLLTPNNAFISPGNISNLINQTGYIAVLAVGMTLVIVIRHIDLSVGFLAGFTGAIVALLMTQTGLHMFVAIPIVLVIGLLVGLINAFFVSKVGMPAFVISLAGMLIFRGALLQATAATGTIGLPSHTFYQFNAIGRGFIPELWFLSGDLSMHIATIIAGIVGIILMAFL